MIPFFRKLRKKMADDNRPLKYARYAIGEIILVVIGILIALQINTWNEERKSKKATLVYMDRLIDDLKSDTIMLSDHIQAALLKNQFCKTIRNVVDQNEIIQDSNDFVIKLQGVGRALRPSVSTNTIEDLKSTGNLKLVKELEITNSIRNYYNFSPEWWFEEYTDQLVNGYLPIVVDAIPMHIHEDILSGENILLTPTAGYVGRKISSVDADDLETILNHLRENEEFDFQLKRITRSHLVHVRLLSGLKKNAVSLLKDLEDWKQLQN
ncbi:DUF6090 family protein [Lutimonas zeaxanthinifaciens]|uniref:DUF6090 family protein n=1 Tax=Lutimonas zeaxanthinifaciens TaxID=3060215 RepID=UPI00265CE54B|nr:DUF6090 family protein [Lutimonas sp. YSD2104]WKK67528.1 DUF6090 family protein [Lutimonas sp. YSD2104]